VNTMDDFLAILRDELGLQVDTQHASLKLNEVADWDSVYLLSLLTILERRTGRSLQLAKMLEAATLEEMYAVAVAA
jgi:acyl carrier protein